MRLINTRTLKLEDFSLREIPEYAILSHTWSNEEVTFQDMSVPSRNLKKNRGYHKIKQTCELAQRKGLEFAWVDTCCIDKSSSAELTESINSMFVWYQNAAICYVYLEDLPANTSTEDEFASCRWFTRGWTLQELIAPRHVEFYDRVWQFRGSKQNSLGIISKITKIQSEALSGKRTLQRFSVAQRMSWAARRLTTRIEDIAYCLLGIFDVNMPLIYGEGQKAFRRLQEEIIKRNNDLTIFAWEAPQKHGQDFLHLMAPSPKSFAESSHIVPFSNDIADFSVTNKGLLISGDVPVRTRDIFARLDDGMPSRYVILVGYTPQASIGIYVRKIGPQLYCRDWRLSLVHFQDNYTTYIVDATKYYILFDLTLSSAPFSTFRDGALHIASNDVFSIRSVVPEILWDDNERVFLKHNQYSTIIYPTVIAMTFSGTLEGILVQLAVLCDYRKQVPDFKMLRYDQYVSQINLLFSQRNRVESMHWEELEIQAPGILKSSSWVDITVRDQVFRISVSSEERFIEKISSKRKLFSMKFDIRLLDKSQGKINK